MKNMRVSLKLIVSFLIVVVFAVFVGGVGIFGMYQINSADDALYHGNYLPTVMAGDISQKIYEQRTYVRSLIIYDAYVESTSFNNANTSLDESIKEMNALLDEYDGTIVNPEDRAAFNELVRVYEGEWLPFIAEMQVLGRAGRNDEAKALLSSAGPIATAAALDELTSKLQQVNLNDGETSVNNNTSLFFRMAFIEVGALAVSVAVALYLAFHIARLISKPLSVLTAFMNKAGESGDITMSQGEKAEIAEHSQTRDEIGQCIKSTAKFLEHLTDISDSLGTVANGDLTATIHMLSDNDTMGVSLQKMVDNLNSMFGEINSASSEVSAGSKQIADGAQALAQGSTEQAATVEQLSSSISEIAQKTKQNAEMAGKAANLAGTIKVNAEKGSQQMDEMMSAVKEINQASHDINKVIKVIDDIAFQTNILALNAAVEAARAGQHGKGFAVVAEEVRNLAAKSAEAAKDTGGLIANSMEKAELGAHIADQTAASLAEIVSGINESGVIVEQIAASSEEQSVGIMEINKAIDQVTQVVQQNSATAQESAAASQEMSGQSNMLQGLVSQFKLKNSGGMFVESRAGKPEQLAMPPRVHSGDKY